MNATAASNRTVRDIVVFVLGAGLTAVVLVVLYYTFPPSGTSPIVVSDDANAPTVPEESAERERSFSQQNVSASHYDVDSLADIFSEYSRNFDQYAALYSLASQADEQQLVDLFNESLTYEYSESVDPWIPDNIRRALLSRLVHLNEEVANSVFADLESERQMALSYTLARELASIDLDRAVDFVSSLAENVNYSGIRGILDLNRALPMDELKDLAARLGDSDYIQNLVERDLLEEEAKNPAEAWATISADPDLLTEENWSRIGNIVEAWVKKDGVSVLDTVSGAIEDEEFKERIIGNGLRSLAEENPEAAFDYALQFESGGGGLFDMSYNPYMYSVLNSWVRESPLDALNKVLTIEPNSQKNEYVDDVFRSWSREDLRGMIDSIPHFPAEIQDAARLSAIPQVVIDSIEDAVSLFEEIENDAKKSQAAMSIAYFWIEEDPEAALNWAQTNPSTESIRPQLTVMVLTNLASKDPQKAFDAALDFPLNEDGVGLEANVLTTMAYTNVDKALEMLPKVRSGATQTAAYMGVGG